MPRQVVSERGQPTATVSSRPWRSAAPVSFRANVVAGSAVIQLKVPATVEQAASRDAKMFAGGVLEYGRTFVG